MSTIFTDDITGEQAEITVGDPALGRKGRELCIASATHEVRVFLTDEQLSELAEEIEMAGIYRGLS